MSDEIWPHHWIRTAIYTRRDMPGYGVMEIYEGGYLPVRLPMGTFPRDVWIDSSGGGVVFAPTLEQAWKRLAAIRESERDA